MNKVTTILAVCFVSLGSQLLACAVPVFRYALENWEPDRLTVAILHDGDMSAEMTELVTRLELATEADEPVNLQLHPIDVSAEHPEGSGEAFHAKQWRGKELPHMLVFFSNHAPEPQLAWSAQLNETNVDRLLSSPARKQVVERLLDGQTAVWVLLKTGNKSADDAAEQTLREELAKKPDEIQLPSLTDLATEEKFDEQLAVEMRVEFSIVTIDPDDEQETFFREMLLSTESDLRDFDEPIAIPIYGRGRTYFALVSPGITPDNITDNCSFLCGACSCEVKRDNPGQDLLLAANWNQVQPGNWVNETPLPELIGIGGFDAMAESTVETDKTEHAAATSDETLVASISDSATSGSAAASSRVADGPIEPGTSVTVPTTTTVVYHEFPGGILIAWTLILLMLGISFTFWQRRRSTE